MATREDLKQQFSDLGVEVDNDVLDKCTEICVLNYIDVEEFVETWMAFSLSYLNGAEPTVENILQMERKEFNKRDVTITPKQDTTPLRIYNSSLNSSLVEEGDGYCATPKSKINKNGIGRGSSSGRTLFSPASFSPDVGTPCSKYEGRSNARQVVLSHGTDVNNLKWRSSSGEWAPDSVSVYNHDKNEQQHIVNVKNKLMMESLALKVDILSDYIEDLTKSIMDTYNLETTGINNPNLEKHLTAGAIFSSDNRLQQSTVMLQSNGLTTELNLKPLLQPNTTCSGLFPGQVVVVEGVNPLRNTIAVQKIFSPRPLPLASTPSLKGPLQIVIAAGPFTQADNLLYEPLEDLIAYIKEHEPHLAILIGPIVDSMHSLIVDGTLAETYEEFYNQTITKIMDQLSCCRTQVVIVASMRDAAQFPVYPVVPFVSSQFPRLITVCDPTLLTINGLVIGVSATDILMHLSREEMPLPSQCSGDRLGRLASHLLSQHNFYPLHPPAEDLPFDFGMWENMCNMPVTPHLLVLPSDLRYFIKNVYDTVVVNPERLAKGQTGGTFARLNIQCTDDSWSPLQSISGQILKI